MPGDQKLPHGVELPLKRAVLVSQMFYPDSAATAKVMRDIAIALREDGFSVEVLSQNRSYLNPEEVYPESECYQEIQVHRVKIPKLNKNSLLQRLWLLLTFTLKAQRKLSDLSGDVYLAVSNPPWIGYWVARKARKSGKPFVFILHDLYPDVLARLGKLSERSLIYRISKYVTKSILDYSSKVVVLGRDAVRYLKSHYDLRDEKMEVVTNWGPSLTDSGREGKSELQELPAAEKGFVVLYSGNLGETADFEVLLDAAEVSWKRQVNVRFLIIGQGKKRSWLEQQVRSRGLVNVEISGYLEEEKYLECLNGADAFFVSLRRELAGISVPSKTYYYLSAGKPIIGVVPEGSEIDLEIREDGYGISVLYDGQSLADGILKLAQDQGYYRELEHNAKNAFKEKYARENVTPKYAAVCAALMKRSEIQ